MNNLAVFVVLVPLLTGLALLFIRKYPSLHKGLSLIGALLMVMIAVPILDTVYREGMLVLALGGWSPPFGIVFAIDLFSAVMILLSSILSLAGILFSVETIEEEKTAAGYYIVWQFLITGINGTFATGDLVNLFVFFEIMLMASYTLLSIGGGKAQLRETFKYLIINVLSSSLLLVAIGCLYAVIGSTNMADIAAKAAQVENQGILTVTAMVFLVVFGTKAAAFPLFFWLPKVHTVAASAVSCIFSGLLIKVGAYALIRMFTLIFIRDIGITHTVICVMAIASMFLGAIGAVSEMNYKSILAYHSVSQIGYVLAGLGLFTVTGLAGSIYFIFHHGIIKGCLFLTAGVTEKITGTKKLKEMGGLMGQYPILAWTFFLAALSLAGVPPLSGFFAKLQVVIAAAEISSYWMMGLSIAAGILTLFSMIKIFLYVFWGKAKREYTPKEGFVFSRAVVPCFLLIAISLAMGVLAEPAVAVCVKAAEQLMTPDYYIQSVLGTA